MTTIICDTAVFIVKERRRCGFCSGEGHNRRTCPTAPQEEKKEIPLPPKEEVVFWSPDLFSGGGLRKMPPAVAWAPGTDSIAFHAQMKSLSFYRYDAEAKLWRRT
jgi:hypothetical protein